MPEAGRSLMLVKRRLKFFPSSWGENVANTPTPRGMKGSIPEMLVQRLSDFKHNTPAFWVERHHCLYCYRVAVIVLMLSVCVVYVCK